MAAAVAVGHALENPTRLSGVDDLKNLRRRKQIYSYRSRPAGPSLALRVVVPSRPVRRATGRFSRDFHSAPPPPPFRHSDFDVTNMSNVCTRVMEWERRYVHDAKK